jgi:hypothetical protein
MYGIDDLQSLTPMTDYEDVPYVKAFNKRQVTNFDVEQVLQTKYPIVYDLLKISADISLCGGSIDSILTGQRVKDFDIFFHCNTEENADKILVECMEYLKPFAKKFRTTQAVETVWLKDLEIQFIRRVYQTKEQVLIGFDLAPSRLGFNIKDKFFATSCGLIAVKNRWFPVDTNQRSLSFDHRLNKYLNKGYSLLLPGLDPNDSKYNTDVWKYRKTGLCFNGKFHIKVDYDSSYTSDYAQDIRGYVLPRFVLKERFECFVLNEGINWIPIKELDDIEIDMSNYHYKYDPTVNFIKLFFKDQADKFLLAKVRDDDYTCRKMWSEKYDYYDNLANNFMDIIKENSWKTENPGDQNFGKLHPINAEPEDWYGANYKAFPVDKADDNSINVYRQTLGL